MATLAGQKVKDAYPSLLKLESGTATSTTKVIEDGAGNDTALKLSTTKVEVNGTLLFGVTPTTGETETSALFLDASGNVIKRTLGSAAFTSGATITATAPIDFTSDVISLDAPTTLSQLTNETAATADSFFIYDASATAHKYITLANLKSYINTGVVVSAAGSNTEIQYNNAGALGASSLFTFNETQVVYKGRYIAVFEQNDGPASAFWSAESYDIPNSTTNGTWFNTVYTNFLCLSINYVVYNATETKKRVGRLDVVWDSNSAGVSPVINDSIYVTFGSLTPDVLNFNAIISGTNVVTQASNSSGETIYIRGSVTGIKNLT